MKKISILLLLLGVAGQASALQQPVTAPVDRNAGWISASYRLALAFKPVQRAGKKPVPVASDEIETGFFESLDLAPDAVIRKTPVVLPDKKAKTTDKKTAGAVCKVAATPARSNRAAARKQTGSFFGLPIQEDLGMWQYLLLMINAVAISLIILVLLRIYKNTRVVESPNNIIEHIKGLYADMEAQNKFIKDIKFRIQKTENNFIKVLGHHIDQKYDQILKDVDMHFQDFSGSHKASTKQYSEISTRITEIESLLESLKEFVAEQKGEIRRLHEGYDWSSINNLCMGLIDVVDSIDAQLAETEDKETRNELTEVRDSLLVLLETHDIKESSPKVGSEFTAQEGDGCQVTMVPSSEPKQKGKVARVIRPSFVYRVSDDQKKVIRDAEIEVYS